jgi:hypothetical protein
MLRNRLPDFRATKKEGPAKLPALREHLIW